MSDLSSCSRGKDHWAEDDRSRFLVPTGFEQRHHFPYKCLEDRHIGRAVLEVMDRALLHSVIDMQVSEGLRSIDQGVLEVKSDAREHLSQSLVTVSVVFASCHLRMPNGAVVSLISKDIRPFVKSAAGSSLVLDFYRDRIVFQGKPGVPALAIVLHHLITLLLSSLDFSYDHRVSESVDGEDFVLCRLVLESTCLEVRNACDRRTGHLDL